jgi:hypothetical protein
VGDGAFEIHPGMEVMCDVERDTRKETGDRDGRVVPEARLVQFVIEQLVGSNPTVSSKEIKQTQRVF